MNDQAPTSELLSYFLRGQDTDTGALSLRQLGAQLLITAFCAGVIWAAAIAWRALARDGEQARARHNPRILAHQDARRDDPRRVGGAV